MSGGYSGGAQTGGNMYGTMGYPQQPSPMQKAFAPQPMGEWARAGMQPAQLVGGAMGGEQFRGLDQAQTGGNMYGSMYPKQGQMGLDANAGMAGGNMGAPQQPSPMQRAFAPKDPFGYGADTPPQSGLLTGDYGQTGGNMYGKMGGGVMPMDGGAMGNAGTGGIPQQGQAGYGGGWGGYGTGGGSRGQVPFYKWDQNMARGPVGRGPATPMPTPAPPPVGGPPTSVPPSGPYPGPRTASAQPDFMAQFGSLLAEDPRLAYGWTYGQQQQPWYQQNQGVIRDQLFGGDQNRMNQMINTAAYAAPLTLAERQRLQGM